MTLADSGGWEQDVRVRVSNKFQMTPMFLAHKSHHEEQGPKPEVPGLDCTLESPEGQGIFFFLSKKFPEYNYLRLTVDYQFYIY